MSLDAFATLSARLDGFWYSQVVHVAASLGLADAIGDEPVSTERLAERVGLQPDPLRRLMRALAAIDVFAPAPSEAEASAEVDAWQHTEQSRLLRDDSPTQLGARAIALGALAWAPWGRLEQALTTGEPSFDAVFGAPFFDHLAANPALAATFGRTMTSFTRLTSEAVASVARPGAAARVVDLGGGHGMMAQALLRRFPELEVTILDRPEVIERGAPAVAEAERARLRLVVGDLFEPASLPRADIYSLSWILHDWDDERCRQILAGCRERLEPGGQLWIVELLTGTHEPAFARFFDLEMLVQTGGRERTLAEFERLLASAGFRLVERIQTAAPQSLLVAQVAS